MEFSLGKKLKDLREYYHVSQRELAKDVCSQKAISKIERGESQPTAEMLHELATRLGVDITYFFTENEAPRFNYVEETKQTIESLVSATKYQEAYEIVKRELKNPLFRKPAHRKFLLWKRAVCHFHLTNEREEALELIGLAMDIETNSKKTITLTDIEIHITLGIMYSELDEFEASTLYYQKAQEMCGKFPDLNVNPQLVKLHYNSSLTYFKMKDYAKSIDVATKGINLAIKADSTFLLGELLYQKGLSLFYSSQTKAALYHMKRAMFLFDIKEQEAFYRFVEANFLRLQRTSFTKKQSPLALTVR